MPNIEWSDIAGEAMERDPRQYPYGYYTGGSFALDTTRVFLWFKSIDELTQHILDIEPRVHDLEPGDGLEEFQERVRPVLDKVRKAGLTTELRLALDSQKDGGFIIDWWGSFQDLCKGKDDFSRELLESFRDDDHADATVSQDEIEDFIEFTRTCGV